MLETSRELTRENIRRTSAISRSNFFILSLEDNEVVKKYLAIQKLVFQASTTGFNFPLLCR